MSKLIAILVSSLFVVSAYAQLVGTPPSQPPTGSPEKLQKLKGSDVKVVKKPKVKMSRAQKRAERVGDKPVN